jgi:NADPH-dependent 2,4-dienoyl-CoA reductase/sulfur reductase-like enzyme
VSVVEPTPVPQGRALGQALGQAVQRYHEARGVRFHTGRAVARLEPAPGDERRVSRVLLDDGTSLTADVVVEALGSRPNVEWLHGNGLDLSDGVLCDDRLRVEGRADVVAVGDIARFPNVLFDRVPRRVEHWCVPADTAKRAAATLAAHGRGERPDATPFTPVPSFWSDQYDLRIQGVGAFAAGERREVLEGSLEGNEPFEHGVVVGSVARGRLVGAVTVGMPPAAAIRYREAVLEGAAALEQAA